MNLAVGICAVVDSFKFEIICIYSVFHRRNELYTNED